MDIQFKILAFHPETASISVNYYCDEIPDGLTYSIDIPMVNGEFASQDEINHLIKCFEPVGQLQRLVDAKNAAIPEHLASYIKKEDVIVATLPTPHEISEQITQLILSGQDSSNISNGQNDVIQMLDAK